MFGEEDGPVFPPFGAVYAWSGGVPHLFLPSSGFISRETEGKRTPDFVVINEQGPSWVCLLMREQAQWATRGVCQTPSFERGSFGNLPVPRGRVGSPSPAVIHSSSGAAIQTRFEEGPWIKSAILRTVGIDPWTILASDDRLDPRPRRDHRDDPQIQSSAPVAGPDGCRARPTPGRGDTPAQGFGSEDFERDQAAAGLGP